MGIIDSMSTPLALLRVAPLLGATSSMTFVFCEDFFIRPLVPAPDSHLRSHANRVLPTHGRWLWPGLGIVTGAWGLSIITAMKNLGQSPAGAAEKWYRAGLIFSLLHFAWGYRALWLLWTIRNDGGDDEDHQKDNSAFMGAWLRVNAWRGIMADFPSWVCYLMAFMHAVEWSFHSSGWSSQFFVHTEKTPAQVYLGI